MKHVGVRFIVAALLLTGMSGADECVPSTSRADVDTGPVSPVFGMRLYVVSDCHPFCDDAIFSIWIYQESNMLDGLQRSDEMVDDTCRGIIEADTIFF